MSRMLTAFVLLLILVLVAFCPMTTFGGGARKAGVVSFQNTPAAVAADVADLKARVTAAEVREDLRAQLDVLRATASDAQDARADLPAGATAKEKTDTKKAVTDAKAAVTAFITANPALKPKAK